MDAFTYVLAVVVGYLCGSIPISRLAGSVMGHRGDLGDIDLPVPGTDETFKITSRGAASASMKYGAAAGCTIGLLDIGKVFLPVLTFYLAYPGGYVHLAAAVSGMVGHNWPLFNRFRGGRGISAAYGGLLVVDWLGSLVCAVVGLLFGLVVLQDFVFAYMAGLFLMVPWLWFATRDPVYVLYALVVSGLFVIAMIPDLRQYLRLRKQGVIDLSAAMDTSPMGRGMMKMMRFFRRDKG